jgi:hypothetical protein
LAAPAPRSACRSDGSTAADDLWGSDPLFPADPHPARRPPPIRTTPDDLRGQVHPPGHLHGLVCATRSRSWDLPKPAGLGVVLGARLLAEFGDNTPLRRPPSLHELRRHPRVPANSARRRPCWPATCTTTGSSTHSAGRRWPRCAPHPARAHDDRLRARGVGHHAALGQLGDRLVALLHGCLTTGTIDDEATRGQSNSKTHKLLLDKKAHGVA